MFIQKEEALNHEKKYLRGVFCKSRGSLGTLLNQTWLFLMIFHTVSVWGLLSTVPHN